MWASGLASLPLRGLRDGGDLVGEVDLAVVLGLVSNLLPGVGDAPETMRIAADAVDDEEGHPVLVGDVLRLDHADGLLDLIPPRQVGPQSPVHDLDVAGLDVVDIVVARPADPPLH